jgi:hypothetical protein
MIAKESSTKASNDCKMVNYSSKTVMFTNMMSDDQNIDQSSFMVSSKLAFKFTNIVHQSHFILGKD